MKCPKGTQCECSDPAYCHRGCTLCDGTRDVDLFTYLQWRAKHP